MTGFLPSCGFVSITVWRHHLDSNKKHGEKARWELYKNTMCYFDQILEAAVFKTAVVQAHTSHLTNYPMENFVLGLPLNVAQIIIRFFLYYLVILRFLHLL